MELVKAYIEKHDKELPIGLIEKGFYHAKFLYNTDSGIGVYEVDGKEYLVKGHAVQEIKIPNVNVIRNSMRQRPLPSDVLVPPGYERRSNGMIAPVHLQTSEVRSEGLHHESLEFLNQKKEFWRFWFLLSAIFVLCGNITVVAIKFINPEVTYSPVGIIPVPFLIWTLIAMNRAIDKYKEQERIEQERQDTLDNGSNGRRVTAWSYM